MTDTIKYSIYLAILTAVISALGAAYNAIYDAGYTDAENKHSQANVKQLQEFIVEKDKAVAEAIAKYIASHTVDTSAADELEKLRKEFAKERTKNAKLLNQLASSTECPNVPIELIRVFNDTIRSVNSTLAGNAGNDTGS